MSTRGKTSKLVSGYLTAVQTYSFPSVSVDLHRWFDRTKNNKPIGWFWIPAGRDLSLLSIMHAIYVGKGVITPTAGKTTNVRSDPETVCLFPLFLEKC